MGNRLWSGLVVSAAASVFLAREIDGHSVLLFPISRQYSWSRDIPEVTGKFQENAPDTYSADGGIGIKDRGKENFSEELLELTDGGNRFPLYFFEHLENGNYNESNQVAQRRGVCGDPRQGGQNSQEDYPYSTPNSEWPVLGTFESGAEIEMILSFGADHKGHFEFFLCDIDDQDDPAGVVTQECLNKHPLNRVAKPNESPVDPNYPGRWYPDPPCRADMGEVEQTTYENPESSFPGERNGRVTYRLPDIECSHCVLQKVWHTGQNCYHIGYLEFNPPSWNSECAPNKEDWVNLSEDHLRRGPCGVSNAYPQEFWSCADIALVPSGSTGDPPASPSTPMPAPATGSTTRDDGGDDVVGEDEYPRGLGCFRDSQDDRVLMSLFADDMMTTGLCLQLCTEDGAVYAATQYGSECWCSNDFDIEYDRHGDDVECDMPCVGYLEEEMDIQYCGGVHAFNLYQLEEFGVATTECQGEQVLPYEQCGGYEYDGPTCCTTDHVCTGMPGNCYSQCRPF
eukprot:g5932.t1